MNSKPFVAIVFAGLILSACSPRYQTPTAMGGDDDDAVCQSRGLAVGSPEYVACRKDRDVQRQAADARRDRSQRDLGEYMLNHPDTH